MRSNRQIIESHLHLREAGQLEEDLRQNYAEDVVVIDRESIYRGHDGVRESARVLRDSLGDSTFDYNRVVVDGRTAYLLWRAECEDRELVHRGIDTFLVEDGRIKAQTIYYHVDRDGVDPD